ncbi:Rha family transcriptional regulator [Oleidesulfovibrio alaskensis]
MTTSLKVAEVFGKRHDHVIRDIRTLIAKGVPNFGESSRVRAVVKSGSSPRMCVPRLD